MSMASHLVAVSGKSPNASRKNARGCISRPRPGGHRGCSPSRKLRDGEVLIRVGACGICGTDLKKIQHGFVAPPQIFGHEVAGHDRRGGTRACASWKEGDRVVSFHHIPCGACFYCERRLFSQCAAYKKVGLTAGFEPNGGGFAEYVRAMPWIVERGMVRIPDEVSFEEATFVEPVNTCLKAVEKARIAAGETRCGDWTGSHRFALDAAGTAGRRSCVHHRSDARAPRGERASRARPRHSILLACSVADEVRARTEGRGADAVLVAVPLPSALAEGLAIARPGGRVLLFAQNDPHMKIEFPAAAVGVEEKEILGSYSAAWDRQEESGGLVFSRALPLSAAHHAPVFPGGVWRGPRSLAARPNNSLKILIVP